MVTKEHERNAGGPPPCSEQTTLNDLALLLQHANETPGSNLGLSWRPRGSGQSYRLSVSVHQGLPSWVLKVTEGMERKVVWSAETADVRCVNDVCRRYGAPSVESPQTERDRPTREQKIAPKVSESQDLIKLPSSTNTADNSPLQLEASSEAESKANNQSQPQVTSATEHTTEPKENPPSRQDRGESATTCEKSAPAEMADRAALADKQIAPEKPAEPQALSTNGEPSENPPSRKDRTEIAPRDRWAPPEMADKATLADEPIAPEKPAEPQALSTSRGTAENPPSQEDRKEAATSEESAPEAIEQQPLFSSLKTAEKPPSVMNPMATTLHNLKRASPRTTIGGMAPPDNQLSRDVTKDPGSEAPLGPVPVVKTTQSGMKPFPQPRASHIGLRPLTTQSGDYLTKDFGSESPPPSALSPAPNVKTTQSGMKSFLDRHTSHVGLRALSTHSAESCQNMQSDIEVGEMLTSIDTPRVTVAPFSRSFVGLRAMTSPHEPSEEDDTQSEIDKEARRAIRNGLQRAAQQLKVRVLRHRMVLTGVTCLFLFPIISFLAVRGELENKLLTSIESELSLGQFRKAQADAERGLKEFPNQALLHLYNGQALAKLGRKSDALKEMNFAAKARPDDLKLVAMRAKLLTELGDFKSALLAYQWLTAAHYGNQASNLADKAKVEIMLADAKTALVDLNNALKLEPGNTSFYARRAQAHTNLGDYASAIEDWNTVLKAHPQDAIAYAGRARCKYQTGQELADLAKSLTAKDNAQGKALLAMAIGKYQQALDDLNYLITRAPGKPDLRLLRAQCYENLGDYSAAYHDYSFLIGSTPKPSSDLYLKRAKAAAQERKYNVAKTDLGCAIALDDKAFDAYMLRGDLSLLQNRRQDALLDYNRALTLAPGNLSVKQKIDTVRLKLPQSKTPRTGEAGEWTISQDMVKRDPLNAAYQLMVHDQLAQAVLILGDLIKKEPNNLLARRYLAWSCTELQSPEAAIEQFKIIDRFDSLNAIDRAKYDSCLQQIQIQNQTDTDNSPEKLLHAIQADPNNLVLREELCRVYRDLKQYDKCQQAAEEALLVAKDNQQAKFFFDMIKFVHSKK